MRIALHTASYPGETMTMTPLGIGHLHSFIRHKFGPNNVEIKIVATTEEAVDFCADIVAVGAVSHVISEARYFALTCKSIIGCVTIIGGYHITALPDQLPEEFDVGVLGEGEMTFYEIVSLLNNHGFKRECLKDIPGIVFHGEQGPYVTRSREMISNIDELPLPYRLPGLAKEAPVFTSRGCPCRCTFCASHGFWGDRYRMRSAGSVIAEIEALAENPKTKEIAILDDLWMADKKRFRKIAQTLINDGVPEEVTFRGFCRSNMVDKDDILILKEMNYRFVRFGAETGSERLLKELKGPGITIKDHQTLIDNCVDCGMLCGGSFMFGAPGETEEDIKKTVNFLRKNKGKLSICGFYLFNPIPGTQLWRDLLHRGLVNKQLPFHEFRLDMNRPNFDWRHFHYWNDTCLPRQRFVEYMKSIRDEFIVPKVKTKTDRHITPWPKLKEKLGRFSSNN